MKTLRESRVDATKLNLIKSSDVDLFPCTRFRRRQRHSDDVPCASPDSSEPLEYKFLDLLLSLSRFPKSRLTKRSRFFNIVTSNFPLQ